MNPRAQILASKSKSARFGRYDAIRSSLFTIRVLKAAVLSSAIIFLTAGGTYSHAQTAQQNGYPEGQNPPQQYPQPAYGQQPGYPGAAPGENPGAQYPPQGEQQYAPQQAPLGPGQLEQLLAPIALYPDALLAQILTASTYPEQVATADQWLQQMQAQGYGSPGQVAAGADSQNWDPSVKGLTAFPQVLQMMDQNLEWTTQLGDAYFNQPQDVMQTVQALRQRAEQAGTLESSPQETVTQDQGAIQLAPPTPQYVYVPAYNPWSAYGAPISPYPGFSFMGTLGSFFGRAGGALGSGALRFGPGIAMGAFDRTPFGLALWGMSWLGHAVFFHHSPYFTDSRTVADWGYPHGGPRAYAGWNRGGRRVSGYRPAFGRAPVPYRPAGGYGRGGDYSRAGEMDRGRNAYAAPAARPAPEAHPMPAVRPAPERVPAAPAARGFAAAAPGVAVQGAERGALAGERRASVAGHGATDLAHGGRDAGKVGAGASKDALRGGKDVGKGFAHAADHREKEHREKAPRARKVRHEKEKAPKEKHYKDKDKKDKDR